MTGWRRGGDRDQEDLANAAMFAMEALEDLVSGQEVGNSIRPEPFYHLLHCVFDTCREAIPSGRPQRVAVNDIDG